MSGSSTVRSSTWAAAETAASTFAAVVCSASNASRWRSPPASEERCRAPNDFWAPRQLRPLVRWACGGGSAGEGDRDDREQRDRGQRRGQADRARQEADRGRAEEEARIPE